MLLFLSPKRYYWKREDVKITYFNLAELPKINNITISSKNVRGRIMFDSIAIGKDQVSRILNGLKTNGYEIDSGAQSTSLRLLFLRPKRVSDQLRGGRT